MHRYRNSVVTILVSSLFTEGGDWRSIHFFAKQLESRGEKVAMVHVGGKRGFRQACAAAVYAPKLLVNGLGTLAHWHVLMICLMRKDVRIYLHETGFILDQFQRKYPLRYRFVSKILRHNPVLCVSKQAEDHYRERFGSTHTHVVYECPGDIIPPVLDPARKHIVMVGSINERKGVELFSQVADLAAGDHADWQFHWIGSKATTSPIYQSPKVLWHGWQWNPRDIVRQCDVFFLSSIDDPCPLAALEALHMGKRCVVFNGTGTAELIHGIPGCEVFSNYNRKDAFVALKKTIDAAMLPATISNLILDRTGPATFQQAMTNAMYTEKSS